MAQAHSGIFAECTFSPPGNVYLESSDIHRTIPFCNFLHVKAKEAFNHVDTNVKSIDTCRSETHRCRKDPTGSRVDCLFYVA